MTSTVGERVRTAREAKAMSQAKLAKLAGISQPSLSAIESGQTSSLRGSTLVRLAETLAVDPNWLQSGTGPEEPARPSFHQEERALKVFRRLSDDDKETWLVLGQALVDRAAAKSRIS